MKRMATCCRIFLALLLSWGLLSPAWGRDSGDERVIPVIEWRCSTCSRQAFTFDPDDIGASEKNKSSAYQQQNWRVLSSGSPIPKCPAYKGDGSHMFNKKASYTTSPHVISQRKNDYIVLKNGGAIKAIIGKWVCVLCNFEGYAFGGDDLDLWGANDVTKPMSVFNMHSGNRIRDCGFKGPNGMVHRFHVGIKPLTRGHPTSHEMAKVLSNLWYSD